MYIITSYSCMYYCFILLFLFRKTEKIIKQLDLVTSNSSKNRTEIEKYATSESLKIITWPLQQLNALQYDIGLIVAFGHLIKDDVLNRFPL